MHTHAHARTHARTHTYTTLMAHTTHTITRTRTPTRTQHTQAHAHAHPPTCCLNNGSFSTSAHALDTHILDRLILDLRCQDASNCIVYKNTNINQTQDMIESPRSRPGAHTLPLTTTVWQKVRAAPTPPRGGTSLPRCLHHDNTPIPLQQPAPAR